MEYQKEIKLKDGRTCILRNGTKEDGRELLKVFILIHEQTDFLRTYPDENTMTDEDEGEFLQGQTDSENAIELLAEVDGVVAGCAGFAPVGNKDKDRHRADFGISLDKEFWGLGIGSALMNACITCAKKAGFTQLELEVVEENQRAVALYEKAGFTEFGRNPRGFRSRISGYQELIYMRLELD